VVFCCGSYHEFWGLGGHQGVETGGDSGVVCVGLERCVLGEVVEFLCEGWGWDEEGF